jgi:hypothetical protein
MPPLYCSRLIDAHTTFAKQDPGRSRVTCTFLVTFGLPIPVHTGTGRAEDADWSAITFCCPLGPSFGGRIWSACAHSLRLLRDVRDGIPPSFVVLSNLRINLHQAFPVRLVVSACSETGRDGIRRFACVVCPTLALWWPARKSRIARRA